jgi:hypothetical protein
MDIEFTEGTYIKRLSTSQYMLDSRTRETHNPLSICGIEIMACYRSFPPVGPTGQTPPTRSLRICVIKPTGFSRPFMGYPYCFFKPDRFRHRKKASLLNDALASRRSWRCLRQAGTSWYGLYHHYGVGEECKPASSASTQASAASTRVCVTSLGSTSKKSAGRLRY